MQLHSTDDTAWWNAFRDGDDEALIRLYQLHLSALYNYGYNLVRQRALVEDAIQDVFLYLYEHRQLGEAQNVRAYLMRSLRHRILHLLKRDDLTDSLADTDTFQIDATLEPAWVQDEADTERSRRLKHLLNQLPKRQREALYLIYYQQLSYPEAAEVMQVDVKSVYNFVYKALTTIRETTGVADWLLMPISLALLSEIFENSSI